MSLPTTKIMVSSTSYRCKMELLFRSPGKLECVVLCHEKTPKTNLSTCSSSAWFHVFSMVLVLDYYHHHPHWIPRSQARHPVGHPSVSSTKASGFYIHQMNRKIICPPWLLRMLLLWLHKCVSRIQASRRTKTQRLYPLRQFLDHVMPKTRLRTGDDSRISPWQIMLNHIMCHT